MVTFSSEYTQHYYTKTATLLSVIKQSVHARANLC